MVSSYQVHLGQSDDIESDDTVTVKGIEDDVRPKSADYSLIACPLIAHVKKRSRQKRDTFDSLDVPLFNSGAD